MKTIELDASRWRNVLDFYEALLAAIGAPSWHGRNLNALLETMIWYDDINRVAPPYAVCVKNGARAPADVMTEVLLASHALREAGADFRRKNGRDRGVSLCIA